MKRFWGALADNFKIDPDSLFKFLNVKGFFTFKPKGSSSSILVKVKDKIVKQVFPMQIRKYCWEYIEQTYTFENPDEQKKVTNQFVTSKSLFSPENMDLLKVVEIKEVKDTKERSYIFFRNCVLDITASGIQKMDLNDIDGHIAYSSVIEHPIPI